MLVAGCSSSQGPTPASATQEPPQASAGEPKIAGGLDEVTFSRTSSGSAMLKVGGWAVEPVSGTPAKEARVSLDGHPVAVLMAGLPRADVAQSEGKPSWLNCGFDNGFQGTNVSPGEHEVTVTVLTQRGALVKLASRKIVLRE